MRSRQGFVVASAIWFIAPKGRVLRRGYASYATQPRVSTLRTTETRACALKLKGREMTIPLTDTKQTAEATTQAWGSAAFCNSCNS
jgi:hypothetical protein